MKQKFDIGDFLFWLLEIIFKVAVFAIVIGLVIAVFAGIWWLYGWGILIIAQNLSDIFGWGWELPMTHAARFWVGLGASFLTGIFGGGKVYNNKK